MPTFLTFPSGLGGSSSAGKSIKIGNVKTIQVDSAIKANVTATISSETDTDRVYDFTFTIPQGNDGYSPTVEIFHQTAVWRINEDKAPMAFFETDSTKPTEFDLTNLNSVEIISWWTNNEDGSIPLNIKFYKGSTLSKTESITAITEQSFKFDTTNYTKMTIETTGNDYANGQIIYNDETHETGYYLKFTYKENGIVKSFVTENLKGKNGEDGKTLQSVKYNFTLAANAWSNDNTATIRIPSVNSNNLIDIGYQESITNEQLDSILKAKLVCIGQAENEIILKAFGEKPLVNIPLTAVVEGSYLDIKTVEQVYGSETAYGQITIDKNSTLAIPKAVGKFNEIGSTGEIFNSYTQNKSLGGYSHSEGYKTAVGIDSSNVITSTTRPNEDSNTSKIYLYDGSYFIFDTNTNTWTVLGTNSSQHAEGQNNIVYGQAGHSEGQNNKSYGPWSHTEGYENTVYGKEGHAEGYLNTIYGNTTAGHVEGCTNKVGSDYGHAEGLNCEVYGTSAHAQNWGTIAASNYQTSLGKFNIKDEDNTYAVIIGDGTSNTNRHNLIALGWDSRLYLNTGDADEKVINLMELGGAYKGTKSQYGLISVDENNKISLSSAPVSLSYSKVPHENGDSTGVFDQYSTGVILNNIGVENRYRSLDKITYNTNSYASAPYKYSTVAGEGTVANSSSQFVIGKFNDYDDETSTFPFIIGNGASDTNRSNLFAIDSNGNIIIKGVSYNLANISGGSGSSTTVSYSPTLTSGTEIGKLTVGGTIYTLYSPASDTKVTNTLNTTKKAYITGTTSSLTNTGGQIFDTGVYLGEGAGTLCATTFYGNLQGTAMRSETSSKVAVTANSKTGVYRPYFDTIVTGGASLKGSSGFTIEETINNNSKKSTLNLGNNETYSGALKLFTQSSGGNILQGNTTNNSTVYTNYLPKKNGTLAIEEETETITFVSGKEIIKKNGNVVTVIFNGLTLSEYVDIPTDYLPKETIVFTGAGNTDGKTNKVVTGSNGEKVYYVSKPAIGFCFCTLNNTRLEEVRFVSSMATEEALAHANYGSTSTVITYGNYAKNTEVVLYATVTYLI